MCLLAAWVGVSMAAGGFMYIVSGISCGPPRIRSMERSSAPGTARPPNRRVKPAAVDDRVNGRGLRACR